MSKERDMIKQETESKIIKKIVARRKDEREEISDALSLLYIAGLRDRLIVGLMQDLVEEIKESSTMSSKNQDK